MDNSNLCQEFAYRVANLFVKHQEVEKIWKILNSRRFHRNLGGPDKTPKNTLVIGPSGSGKSEALKQYACLNPGYEYIDENRTTYDIKPVVYMELPHPFTILEFYQSIAEALGNFRLPGRPSIGEAKERAFCLLKQQRVELLILDEIDFIISSKHVTNEEAMDTIKSVTNKSGVSLVCAGTPAVEPLFQISFQHFRRHPRITVARFESCNEEFCSFLNSIEEEILPPYPIGLGKIDTLLPQTLFKMSQGLVGIVIETILEAYRLLGVFEEGFNDPLKSILTFETLLEAYNTTVGEVTEKELLSLINK